MLGVDSSVVNNTLRVGNMPVAGIPGEDARMNQDKSTCAQEVRRDAYHAQVGITEPDHVFEEGPPHSDRAVCYAQTDVEFDHSQVMDDIQLMNLCQGNETSAASAKRIRGVSPEHLSRVWRIDHETAKKTLDVTMQHVIRQDDPKLSRNYGTGDHML